MSLVNLTLVIQAVNFFFAYLILKYLLLKPAVQAVAAEDAHQQELVVQVQQNHQRIDQKKEEIKQRWYDCQQEFAHHAPRAVEDEHRVQLPLRTLPKLHIDEKELTAQARHIEDELVKKVSHVRH